MSIRVEDLPIEVSQGGLVTRYAEFGEMAIRHATLPGGGGVVNRPTAGRSCRRLISG